MIDRQAKGRVQQIYEPLKYVLSAVLTWSNFNFANEEFKPVYEFSLSVPLATPATRPDIKI